MLKINTCRNSLMPRCIFPFFSLALYWIAPRNFEHSFVIIVLVLYILNCFYFFGKYYTQLKMYNFSLLFCFSFLLCNFIYPVFVHPYYPIGLIVHDFNDEYICRGAALAQVGISFYLFGEDLSLMKTNNSDVKKFGTISNNDVFDSTSILLLWIYAIIVFVFSGLSYDMYNELFSSSLSFISIIHVFVIITIICHLSKYSPYSKILYIIKKEKIILVGLIIATWGLMMIGDRGPIIQLILAFFTAYYFVIGGISVKNMCIYICLGVFCMVYIRNNRVDGQYTTAMEYREAKYGAVLPAYIEIFTDLVGNARCMYLGLEIVDRDGFFYGKSFIKPIFSPIPFMPTIIAQTFFNSTPSNLSTGVILTNETESMLGRKVEGVGTNNVVDIYMNIGFIGVCALMAVFGYFIGYIERNKLANVYCFFCYCILMSLCIYIPRSTIFDFLRTVLWGILIFKIRNSYSNKFILNEKSIIH